MVTVATLLSITFLIWLFIFPYREVLYNDCHECHSVLTQGTIHCAIWKGKQNA